MPFKAGDLVRYIGNETSFLEGAIGVVLEKSPRGTTRLYDAIRSGFSDSSVPVNWDGKGYYGVYIYNIEKISHREPQWEV